MSALKLLDKYMYPGGLISQLLMQATHKTETNG